MSILNLPGVPVLSENAQNAAQTPGAEGTPVAATLQPILETQEAWDGKSRVNLLIMGLDARDLEATAPRTDSMILFTMDPVNLTAGMISIPRDLWVKIHGADYGKINTAYSIGEAYKLPGGARPWRQRRWKTCLASRFSITPNWTLWPLKNSLTIFRA